MNAILPTPLAALQHAVGIAGGQSALARKLSERGIPVKQAHVWWWLNKSGRVAAHCAIPVEEITGVPRSDLRPDVFVPPTPAHGEAA